MSEIETALAAYLAAALRTPFAYGRHDCALFVAGWIAARSGVDVGAPYRGRYRTELGCARVVRRAGGLRAIFARAARQSGAVAADAPQPGDFGLVGALTPGGPALAGALRTRRRWVSLSPQGLVGAEAVPVAIWRTC